MLSPRQREILALVAAGRTSKEIAGALGISESTVNWHLANAFERLGASSRAEAVALAMRDDAEAEQDGQSHIPPPRSRRPPLPMSNIAIALALTLLLGVLGGALMAGWNVSWPAPSPSAPVTPTSGASGSAEPTVGTHVGGLPSPLLPAPLPVRAPALEAIAHELPAAGPALPTVTTPSVAAAPDAGAALPALPPAPPVAPRLPPLP
jgi:DNA-binding CsgD family transcriptional regulator